ncbi:hypothetical protein ACFSHP_14025 [Novosphingobium panipatense]
MIAPLDFAKAVQCWGTVIALFGIADRFWNHDARWRATLAEAVFPVFIAHQTVMVLAGYWLRDKGLTALPEFLALCFAVAAGSWLFYLAGRDRAAAPAYRPQARQAEAFGDHRCGRVRRRLTAIPDPAEGEPAGSEPERSQTWSS